MTSSHHGSTPPVLDLVSMEDVPFFHLWGGHSTVLLKASRNRRPLTSIDAEALGLQSVEVARQSGCRFVTVDLTDSRAEGSFCEDFFPRVRKAGLELAVKIELDCLHALIPRRPSSSPSALCLVCPAGPVENNDTPQIADLLSGWNDAHIELVTPMPREKREISTLSDLLRRIATYDPQTPWHLLHPAEKAEGSRADAGLVTFFRKARRALSHVYLENLPLSRWLDTVCPDCGTPSADRIALRNDCAFLSAHRLDSGKRCPICGRDLGFRGDLRVPIVLPVEQRDPRTGFVSIGNWEAPVDLGTGRPKSDATINPMYAPARELPFPSKSSEIDEWLFAVARHAITRHSPNLLILHTAALVDPLIASTPTARAAAAAKLEELIEVLISKTGYKPVVLGFGNPSFKAPIPAPGARSVVIADERIACCYGPEDLKETLAYTPNVQQVLSRMEMSEAIGSKLDPLIYGDTFAVAAPGNSFASTLLTKAGASISTDRDREIPIWRDDEPIEGVWELREAIASRVLGGDNVALILIEGLGVGSFPFSDKKIRCHPKDFPLSTSMLLSTLSAGKVNVPHEFVPPPWAVRTLSNPLSLGLPFDKDRVTFDVMNTGKYVAVISNGAGRMHRLFPGQICVEPLPALQGAHAVLVACP